MTDTSLPNPLTKAFDSISEGIVLLDADDRVISYNSFYRDTMIPLVGDLLARGVSFEELVREGARRGLYNVAEEALEEFVDNRLQDHRTLPIVREHQLGDGRWARISEYRTDDGGSVVLHSDITDLKKHGQALAQSEARFRDFAAPRKT